MKARKFMTLYKVLVSGGCIKERLVLNKNDIIVMTLDDSELNFLIENGLIGTEKESK